MTASHLGLWYPACNGRRRSGHLRTTLENVAELELSPRPLGGGFPTGTLRGETY